MNWIRVQGLVPLCHRRYNVRVYGFNHIGTRSSASCYYHVYAFEQSRFTHSCIGEQMMEPRAGTAVLTVNVSSLPVVKILIDEPSSPYRTYLVNKTATVISLIAGLSMIGAARADVGLTAEAGTTGVGFHVDVPVRPNLSARFGTAYLPYSYHRSTASLDYDLKREFRTVDVLLDWYPIDSHGFRVSGGLVYNGDNTDVRARPGANGSYIIQGNTYSMANAGRIEGKIDHRKIAPYFGIGWGKARDKQKGWSFSTDVGVLLQGAPNASLTSTGCTSPTALCMQLASDLEKENMALANETGRYKAYPVLRVGIRYQF